MACFGFKSDGFAWECLQKIEKMSSDMLGFEKQKKEEIDTAIKTAYFSHGAQQGTFKISSFESYIVLGCLGLILELSWVSLWISLGLSLDLFGVILVSLGAILATLWPSLGSLRLLLGCLGSLLSMCSNMC